jgi:hypothetical protein
VSQDTIDFADNLYDKLLWEFNAAYTINMDQSNPPLTAVLFFVACAAIVVLIFAGGQYGKRQELLNQYATSTTSIHW